MSKTLCFSLDSQDITAQFKMSLTIKEIFSFNYNVQFEDSLIENEFDHVFIGFYEGDVFPNFLEVSDCKQACIKKTLRAIMTGKNQTKSAISRYIYELNRILGRVDRKT